MSSARRAVARRRSSAIGVAFAALIVPLACCRLAVQTAEMRFPGDPWLPMAMRLVWHSSWGWSWRIQVASALLLLALLAWARHDGPIRLAITGAAALVLAATPTMSSHAMSGEGSRVVKAAADYLHVVGGAAWLGTLACMFASMGRDDAAGSVTTEDVWRFLGAFSPLALASAAVVATSGTVSALMHVSAWPMLWTTSYGVTLLAKVAIVFVILALGFRNWKRLTPAVLKSGPAAIRAGMIAELVAAFVVLLLTAALVTTAPPGMSM